VNGKRRDLGVGAWPVVSLAQARQKANLSYWIYCHNLDRPSTDTRTGHPRACVHCCTLPTVDNCDRASRLALISASSGQNGRSGAVQDLGQLAERGRLEMRNMRLVRLTRGWEPVFPSYGLDTL